MNFDENINYLLLLNNKDLFLFNIILAYLSCLFNLILIESIIYLLKPVLITDLFKIILVEKLRDIIINTLDLPEDTA